MSGRQLAGLLLALGIVALTAGAALIYVPAGLIVAGLCLAACGLLFVDAGE